MKRKTAEEIAEGVKAHEHQCRNADVWTATLRKRAPSVVDNQNPRALLVSMMSPVESDPYWASGCLREISEDISVLAAICENSDFTKQYIGQRLDTLSLRVLAFAQMAQLLTDVDEGQAASDSSEAKEAAQ